MDPHFNEHAILQRHYKYVYVCDNFLNHSIKNTERCYWERTQETQGDATSIKEGGKVGERRFIATLAKRSRGSFVGFFFILSISSSSITRQQRRERKEKREKSVKVEGERSMWPWNLSGASVPEPRRRGSRRFVGIGDGRQRGRQLLPQRNWISLQITLIGMVETEIESAPTARKQESGSNHNSLGKKGTSWLLIVMLSC